MHMQSAELLLLVLLLYQKSGATAAVAACCGTAFIIRNYIIYTAGAFVFDVVALCKARIGGN